MKPLAMVLVFGLIVVVVVGIVFRFIGGGGNTGGGGDSDGVAGATGGTSMRPIEDADIVQVTIVSSSTKRDWLDQVVEQFNFEDKTTAAGGTIRVEVSHTRSGSSMNAILDGESMPVVWSPGDQSWATLINETWRQRVKHPLISEACPPTVYAPIGFAMWRPMAEALGWPDTPIGWDTIVELAADPEGWSAYGHPEWGQFRFGHSHPAYSNTGLLAMTSFVYGIAGADGPMTGAQVYQPAVEEAMRSLEQTTAKYGRGSTALFDLMVEQGPSYVHAIAASEETTLRFSLQNSEELRFPLAFIFPAEGTIWADHPYCILDNAKWVGVEQSEVAAIFRDYLLAPEQQALAVENRLRPTGGSIPLHAPIDPLVNLSNAILLPSPDAEVSAAVIDLFMITKRKATVIIVMDVSGSMQGEKIKTATAATAEFHSPEKEDLFLELVIGFNLTRPSGVPPVHAVRTDMVDMLPDAVNGRFGAISPDSSIWLDQLERMWQQKNPGAEPIVHSGTRYALSPIVIAMWSDTAAELGHPRQPVGWNDLLDKASRDARFRWSHSSVSTGSGLLSTTAEFYAGTGERRSLTQDDLTSKQTRNFVRNIEATVTRYGGESEDRVVTRLLAEGGRPLDAFVAQEQSAIYFNRNANYQNLVAIYPEEGTFWMDHPLVSLDGPWVSERQRLTIREFAAYITSPDAQISVLRAGYRPVDPSLSLESPISLIKPEYGADPAEPKRLLKVPSASLLENIREAWLTLKRPAANIYLVVDVSGSMGKEKLTGTKEALLSFIEQIRGDRDRVALVPFSDGIGDVVPLGPSDSAALRENIAALEAGGGTELYQAVAYAYELIRSNTSDDRIGVILAMTDGKSDGEIATLESWAKRDEGSVMIFTVGYGKDADFDVLRRLSSLGAGQTYRSDPNTIRKLYMLIAANF